MENRIKIAVTIALLFLFGTDPKQKLIDCFIEKVEYSYNYMLWFLGDDLLFTEKGYRKENLQVALYWKDGSYYFIPLDDCNTEMKIDGRMGKVCSNAFQEEKYIFYKMEAWTGRNRDCEWWYIGYEASVSDSEIMDFTYLGVVEVDTSADSEPEAAPLERNDYIDAALEYIVKKGELPTGKYTVYIGDYSYREANQVEIKGVIKQDEIYRVFWAQIIRHENDYEAIFFHMNGADELFPPLKEPLEQNLAGYTVQAERLAIDIEIAEEDGEVEKIPDIQQIQEDVQKPQQNKTMTIAQAQEMMEYMYNYCQWFYVKMPYEIERMYQEGEDYTLFTDGQGNVFWYVDGKRVGIYQSQLQMQVAELPLSSYEIDSASLQALEEKKIGTIIWHNPVLNSPDLPLLTEDGYINAVTTYIRDKLFDEGKNGEYQIYYGRYEILSNDVRNISLAVVGEDNYFVQCWVTKWQDGTYECLPISVRYAEKSSLDMEKVNRIMQLERLVQIIQIENRYQADV